VTVLIELKARFDEINNISWAKRLEHAGAHVVFGFINLKTHAKCCLVIRREKDKNLRRYVHLSTGNYNSTTARVYSDIGLLTSDPVLCDDVSHLFNFLTGFNILRQDILKTTPPELEKIRVAPFKLREYFLGLIEAEMKIHTAKNPGHIILKMNALVDTKLCQALFKASQKGVKINLIVRGECILRPGLPGVSENIRVISIVDRFLEHSRIFWFQNGGNPKVYCGSADFMPRNMDRRVELIWPVEKKELKDMMTKIIHTYLKDNQKSHEMLSDGSYEKIFAPNEKPFRCQEYFIEKTRKYGVKSLDYDLTTQTSHFQFQDDNLVEFERLLPGFIVEETEQKKKLRK
jgi:polyphosphate kinase